MDADLITVIVIGVFLNLLVLFKLTKIYKDTIGVIWRYGIFAIIEFFAVYFISKAMLFPTFFMLGLLGVYIISLGFRSSNNKKANQDESVEAFKNMNEEEKADFYQKRKEQAEISLNELNEKHALKCPYCKSKNVDFMQNNKKGFSVGKAAAGTVLTGGIGAVAGFAGKKGNNQWHCKECGQIFETKHKK